MAGVGDKWVEVQIPCQIDRICAVISPSPWVLVRLPAGNTQQGKDSTFPKNFHDDFGALDSSHCVFLGQCVSWFLIFLFNTKN